MDDRIDGRFAQQTREARGGALAGPMRQPHVAELVAHRLRERILQGDLRDGDLLPKQEDLLAEYGVSKPSVREALRILETEGLVSVRRGKAGGAVVHRPRAENLAYTLELVLRARGADVGDVGTALRQLEPLCASLCAARPDRHTAVLPELRRVHEEATACIDDELRFTHASRRFHETLVALCGSETMILVVGALEAIWTAHADTWARENTESNSFPEQDYRRRGLEDHEVMLRLIDRGDTTLVVQEATKHLEWAPVYEVRADSTADGHILLSGLPD